MYSETSELWSVMDEQRIKNQQTIRNNALIVIENTTAMPFRWLRTCYRCFYCYDIFQEPIELKNHQNIHANTEVIEKAFQNYWETAVFIDISNLTCKLCQEKPTDLSETIDHLVDYHHLEFDKTATSSLIAFHLYDRSVACVVCDLKFRTFGPLLFHTNKDHKVTSGHLCDYCAQSFKSEVHLKVHLKTVHTNKKVLCSECGMEFVSRQHLKTHAIRKHGKTYKCLICSETFPSNYRRSQHMVAQHQNRVGIKCPHCPKTFIFRSMMVGHLRRAHLKDKNYLCDMCDYKGYSETNLRNHMFKHSGIRNFKCSVCDKAFYNKKVLGQHCSRIHKIKSSRRAD